MMMMMMRQYSGSVGLSGIQNMEGGLRVEVVCGWQIWSCQGNPQILRCIRLSSHPVAELLSGSLQLRQSFILYVVKGF